MFKIASLLFFVSLSISPLYVFRSGLPQLADFVMALSALFVFAHATRTGGDAGLTKVPLALRLLLVWVFGVGMYWGSIYSSLSFLWDTAFLAYNVLVAGLTLHFLEKHPNGRSFLSRAILCAFVVSSIGVLSSLDGLTARNVGFFNNPNQLAYFSLCATGCLMALNNFRITSPSIAAGYLMGALGVLSAASLGASAGFILLIAALIAGSGRSFIGTLIIPVFAIVVVALVVIVDLYFEHALTNLVEVRLARSSDKVNDIVEERNYDRIIMFPEYTIFGAGSSMHELRFFPHGVSEIHSTFGSLLFNYGAIGLGLFLLVLFSCLRRASFPMMLTIAGPLAYSLTHVGTRFTLFWVLLMIILFLGRNSSDRAKS